jgi:uncharacterized membrane protein
MSCFQSFRGNGSHFFVNLIPPIFLSFPYVFLGLHLQIFVTQPRNASHYPQKPQVLFSLFDFLFTIAESRPLKTVAREKWGTHDALRA